MTITIECPDEIARHAKLDKIARYCGKECLIEICRILDAESKAKPVISNP